MKGRRKKSKTNSLANTAFDSQAEVDFAEYLRELHKENVVGSWEKVEKSVELLPSKKIVTPYKTWTQRSLSYTPDFNVDWNTDHPATALFGKHFMISEGVSVIEVKPPKNYYNEDKMSILRMKLYYEVCGQPVTMVKIPDLFGVTFTPLSCAMKRRKGWPPFTSIKSFIDDES